MKFAKAGTTASKRASERRFRPPLIPTEGTGESERCGTIFRRIEFSAVRVGAQVRGRRATGGYCTHSTFIVLLLLRQTAVAWIPQPPSLQFFFYSSSSSGCHSLPSPVSFPSIRTSQSSLLRSALLSGLSFAALNFFRPPSALRLRPHSAPARRPISPIALPPHWAFLRSTLLRSRDRRMHG